MKNNLLCPKCGSTDTKRIIFEYTLKEFILLALLIVFDALYFAYLRHWMPGDKWDIFNTYEFQVYLVVGTIGFVLFPFLLNLRFPRYKCKSCGYKFKPNGEEAENVFDDYE